MKQFILSTLLLFSSLAFGQQPLQTKGQSQSTLNPTLKLQAPHNQVTKISDKSVRIETGSYNLVSDPGFEKTASNGFTGSTMNCFTADITNTVFSGILEGAQHLEMSLGSLQTGSCTSPTYLIPFGAGDQPGELKFRTKHGGSSTRTLTLEVFNQSNTLLATSTFSSRSDGSISLPFTFPTYSAGVSGVYYKISADSASSSHFQIIDDVYIGPDTNAGRGNVRVQGRAYRNAALSGLAPNNTSVKINLDAEGTNADPQNIFNTSTNRFEIPFSGHCSFNGQIAISGTNVLGNYYGAILKKNGSDFVFGPLPAITTASASFRVNVSTGPMRVLPGDYFELFLFGAGNNSASTLSAAVGESLTFLGADCAPESETLLRLNVEPSFTPWTSYTPTFVGFGTPSSVEFQWRRNTDSVSIRGIFVCGTSTSVSASFTLPNSITVRALASQTTWVAGRWNRGGSSGSSRKSSNLIVVQAANTVNFGNDDYTTAQAAFSAQLGSNVCSNGDVIEVEQHNIPITSWNVTTLMPLVAQSVINNTNSVTRTEYGVLNCDSGSAITSQGGTWISSVGNIASGVCAVTLVTGMFSATPTCGVSMNQNIAGTNTRTVTATPTSATNVNIDCSTGAADCTAYDVNFFCMGPR